MIELKPWKKFDRISSEKLLLHHRGSGSQSIQGYSQKGDTYTLKK